MIKRLTIVPLVLICLLFFSYFSPAFADNGNASSDIERIVVTPDNVQTIYYKNGTVHHYFTVNLSVSMHFGISSQVTHILPPFPLIVTIMRILKQIFDVIEQIMEGVFSPVGIALTLLSTEILIMFKNLRHNRPRDYRDVSFVGLATNKV